MTSSPTKEIAPDAIKTEGTSDVKEHALSLRVDIGTQTDVTSADIDRWIELEKQIEKEETAKECRNESKQEQEVVHEDPKPTKKTGSETASNAVLDGWNSTQERTAKTTLSSAVGASESQLYLVGGATDIFAGMVESYSSSSKKWEQAFALPPGVEWMSPACAAHGSSLYVIGEVDLGCSRNLGTLWKYNVTEEIGWKKMAALAKPRVNLCLLDTPNGIYAMGGRCGDQAVSLVERYEPERDAWMATHSMAKARCYFGAVAANGALYAIDGMKKSNCIHKTTEMLDPRIGTWNLVSKKPTNGRTAFSLVYYRNSIYVFGGIQPLRGNTLNLESSCQIFDLRMNEWRAGPSMSHRRAWSCAGVLDDTVYVIGGRLSFRSEAKNAPIERLVGDRFTTDSAVEVSGPRAFASACVI